MIYIMPEKNKQNPPKIHKRKNKSFSWEEQ